MSQDGFWKPSELGDLNPIAARRDALHDPVKKDDVPLVLARADTHIARGLALLCELSQLVVVGREDGATAALQQVPGHPVGNSASVWKFRLTH